MDQGYRNLWVCVNCIMHHANGECGDCHGNEHQDGEPLSLLDYTKTAMGFAANEHACGRECGEEVGECDCEIDTYSSSQCDGCGSWYHGERHAMTEWV